MILNRELLKHLDWFTIAVVLGISMLGLMTIFSATRPPLGGEHPDFYLKQAVWLLIGITLMVAMISFDYIWLARASLIIYAVGIILMAAVFLIGRVGMGAQRWISLGPLSFQPSELFKLCFIIMFSRYMSALKAEVGLLTLLKAFLIYVALPFTLLLKQPDLGTALVLLLMFAAITITSGVNRKVLVFFVIVSAISIPFLGGIFWDDLRDYQKNRIVAFVNPDVDPDGIGYNITQSKVAIGSGSVAGKGYMQGTQAPFRFLPERHTDFIFSSFAEEWGFLGSIGLLLLYLMLLLRGLDTAMRAKDEFGRLLAVGISFMYFVYISVNIGMTMGLAPIVGLPLPFMSYGGTALITNMMAAGILVGIRARRFELFY